MRSTGASGGAGPQMMDERSSTCSGQRAATTRSASSFWRPYPFTGWVGSSSRQRLRLPSYTCRASEGINGWRRLKAARALAHAIA